MTIGRAGCYEACSALRNGAAGDAMIGACESGYARIVTLMIKHGAQCWDYALTYACMGGHIALAQLMIKHGARDLNDATRVACLYGHHDVSRMLRPPGRGCYCRE